MADLSGEEQLDIKAALDEIRNVARKGKGGTTKEERKQKMDEVRDLPGLSGRQAGQSQSFSDNQTNRLGSGQGTEATSDNATQYQSNQGGGEGNPDHPGKKSKDAQVDQNAQQGNLDADRRKKKEKQDQQGKGDQQSKLDKYYSKPIGVVTWLTVGAVAVAVDGITLVLAIIGVGEILGWVIGALFVPFYYLLIYFRAPKQPGFRTSLNFRGIANFLIENIPYLGSVWIGNSLVVGISFLRIRRWQKGQPGLGDLSGVGAGDANPKRANATSSASG